MSAADRPLLSNPRSERVKQVAALGRRAARERSGTFLVEGPQAVRELLGYAASAARALYLTAAAEERHAEIADAAGAEALAGALQQTDKFVHMAAEAEGISLGAGNQEKAP